MCSQWLSYRRGMQRYGPTSWSVILQDPDFAGLTHRTPGQLKDRCRSVLQYLIRAGVDPDNMQPWILGTPLGPWIEVASRLSRCRLFWLQESRPMLIQSILMITKYTASGTMRWQLQYNQIMTLKQIEFRQFDNISKVSPQRVINKNTRSLQGSVVVYIYDYEVGQWIFEDPGVIGKPDLIGKSNKMDVERCYYNGSLVKYFPNLPVVFKCAIDKE
ncbi:hypothetical protein MP228_004948 [Amoeboaphelidium protococcarum]|nr:hypothetical protein MP228_004948 [Amoeboaphelidium protococcarum]